MKHLIFINGTMGVGKTTTSRELQKLLPCCAFLDGDWCWDMRPFMVTDETKQMVMDNVCYVLNNFLKCSQYENIIFCWVMHEEVIMDRILASLDLENAVLYKFSLVCTPQALMERITKDVEGGLRTQEVIERSLSRLNNYASMDTIKIDVSEMDAKEAAEEMIKYVGA